MQPLINLIASHQYTAGLVSLWIFSAFVGALPKPQPSERWYGALYNFFQSLGANLSLLGKKSV